MEFTPNLKLTQYGRDDVTSWITGYSQDMEKIDTAFGDLANTTSVSNARLEAVEADTAQVKTDVAQMKEDIAVNSTSIANAVMDIKTINERETNHYDALSGEIDTIKQNQASDEDAIKVIQTNTANMRDRIAVNTASISKLQVRVETLEDTVEANQQENVENINRNTANIAQLQQDLTDTDALARKAAIDAASAVNTSSVASAKVVELTSAVEKNVNDISNIKNEIDGDIDTRISTNTNAISELTPRVTKNEQDISNINTGMETVDSRLDALENDGSTEAITQRVTALETWEGQAKTQITTAQQTADTANTVAENVQSQVSGIKSGATVPFSLGIDAQGNYGYVKEGADTVTPFLKPVEILELGSAIPVSFNNVNMPQYTYYFALDGSLNYPFVVVTPAEDAPSLYAVAIDSGREMFMQNNYRADEPQGAIQRYIAEMLGRGSTSLGISSVFVGSSEVRSAVMIYQRLKNTRNAKAYISSLSGYAHAEPLESGGFNVEIVIGVFY